MLVGVAHCELEEGVRICARLLQVDAHQTDVGAYRAREKSLETIHEEEIARVGVDAKVLQCVDVGRVACGCGE